MLFLLTGDVQIGKTRWLERLASELSAEGCEVAGVVAPGVWRAAGEGGFEKLGIDNVLLPDGERVAFARRRDLARAEGSLDPESQSEAAQLAWHISNDALARVNAHFGRHRRRHARRRGGRGGASEAARGGRARTARARARMRPRRGDGAARPRRGRARFPHALAVVRDWLLPRAVERFGAAWGGARAISPTTRRAGSCRARAASRPEGPSGPSPPLRFSIPASASASLFRACGKVLARGRRASASEGPLSPSRSFRPRLPARLRSAIPLGGVAPRLGTSALAVPPSPRFASPPLLFRAAILARRIPRRSLPARALVLPRHRGSRASLWRTGTLRPATPALRARIL